MIVEASNLTVILVGLAAIGGSILAAWVLFPRMWR